VAYPVMRVSGPLRPMSMNVEWSGGNQPHRPRLVDVKKPRGVHSSSTRGHGSGEIAFV
jgi:hypothetical protein